MSPIPKPLAGNFRRVSVEALAILGCLVACSGGKGSDSPAAPSAPSTPVLTTVNVTLGSATIWVGQNTQASAAGFDQNVKGITIGTVLWSSSAPTVATITTSGAITAVAPGQTTVSAVVDGRTGATMLTVVPVPVASVTVTPAAPSIIVGTTTQLAATTLDANGVALTGRTVVWSSSDTSKARVSIAGLVSAIAVGAAKITAASEGKVGTSAITVSEDPTPRDVSCTDWFSLETLTGRLSNNVWNKSAAGTFPSLQCIRVRGSGAQKQYGWSWSWPPKGTTVYAYPETIVGWSPWSGFLPNDARLPVQVSALAAFDWQYSVETTAAGVFNLATDMFLTRSGKTGNVSNPADIAVEFMIKTYKSPEWVGEGGTKVGEVTVSGATYEIYYAADVGDNSGVNSNRWAFVSYNAKVSNLSPTIDVKAMLDDAVQRGFFSSQLYVSDIELGNEIISGTGETWITRLLLNVQRKLP